MSTSRPSTPPSHQPAKKSQWRFKTSGLPVEWMESYHPGGYHPIDIGDTFQNGRYRVLLKLGYGSFSTVWLPKMKDASFFALKIGKANQSETSREASIYDHLNRSSVRLQHVAHLLSTFYHEGPNGKHECLVFEVMGPSVIFMLENLPEGVGQTVKSTWERTIFPIWMAKRLIKQLVLRLHSLHTAGIAHGDLQFGNMLFGLESLHSETEQTLTQMVAQERHAPFVRIDGKVDLWAPKHLIMTAPLNKYVDLGPDFITKLSDLGAAFPIAEPPPKATTPAAFRAPEIVLNLKFDHRIDIWSLGCLIFEFLTGMPPFPIWTLYMSDLEVLDEHLMWMTDVLGHLPQELSCKWPRQSRYYAPNGEKIRNDVSDSDAELSESESKSDAVSIESVDSLGPGFAPVEPGAASAEPDGELINDGDETASAQKDMDDTVSLGKKTSNSGESVVEQKDEEDVTPNAPPLREYFHAEKSKDVGEAEAEQIVSLLRKLLQYDPEMRPTTTEVLQDPWIKSLDG